MKNLSQQDIQKELLAVTTRLLAESGEPYKRDIKLNDSLQHLGIDSLGRAELFQRIEKTFGVCVPDRLLAEAETLNDIANYLYNALDPALARGAGAEPSLKPEIIPQKVITSHGEKSNVDPTKANTLLEIVLL